MYHLVILFPIAIPKWQCYWIVKLAFLCSLYCNCGQIQTYLNSSYHFSESWPCKWSCFHNAGFERAGSVLPHCSTTSDRTSSLSNTTLNVTPNFDFYLVKQCIQNPAMVRIQAALFTYPHLIFKTWLLVMTTSKFYYEYWMRSFVEGTEWETIELRSVRTIIVINIFLSTVSFPS